MHVADPRFESWLLRETGIDASALGVNVLERAVRERMRIVQGSSTPMARHPSPCAGATDPAVTEGESDAYWNLLNASPDERQALIELLVVPETWFFRDREAFIALAKLACERLMRQPAHSLRILSAPCASGEEPYSISMTLLDAGIGPDRFLVDAIDISTHAIAFAQRAIYGRHSFRGNAIEFRERHFSETAGQWRVSDAVRQPVRFVQSNLLDSQPLVDIRYDFIFCRNVLIYFNRETQDRAIRLLEARLAEGGTIFVGPAETGLMMRHAMSSARIPMAFAFQRTPQGKTAVPAAAQVRPARAAPERQPSGTAPHRAPASPLESQPARARTSAWASNDRETPRAIRTVTTAARRPATSGATKAHERAATAPPLPATLATLDEARSLADAGRLDEAERLARTLTHGPDAGAFYLLGLITDARGRSAEACDFYRKTLYLVPNHYEALAHLAVLLDAAGDRIAARHLTLRAERALKQRDEMAAGAREGGTHGPHRS